MILLSIPDELRNRAREAGACAVVLIAVPVKDDKGRLTSYATGASFLMIPLTAHAWVEELYKRPEGTLISIAEIRPMGSRLLASEVRDP